MTEEIEDIDEVQAEYSDADLERIGRVWLERIKESEKRESKWVTDATQAEAMYSMDDEIADASLPEFNILHSNIETIVPAIYNSTPSPDIRPRHQGKDPVAKAVSEILERTIATQIDDNRLDAEIEGLSQDAFMAGRGVVRVKFDADDAPAQTQQMMQIDPETGQQVVVEVEVSPASLTNERILFEVVSWRDYREGPAKRWGDVPWVAYRHEVTEEELERLENPDYARDDDAEADEAKDCTIWEIWCRETMKVYFVTDKSSKVINIQDDPLQLGGFFPQAAPVQPITLTGKRTPVCPYAIYKTLAQELDRATKRINAIMKGLKVRGAIAADAEAVELMSQADDNELVPIANLENLAAVGGLDKAIMWWPVDMAIAVLQQLYAQREQTKQAIYEITGISDIVRGQGAASETATAQQIKTQWGSLRIKKMQRLVERQVRDLFVICTEIISRQFSIETLQKTSGLQIDENARQVLESPMDHYRIDVESDSTVRADLTKSRGEMSEFLQGTAQFFATMQPIVAASPEAAAPLAKMYASFARQFNLGKAGEDAIEEMAQLAEKAASQPQGPSPEQQAMQAEMQMKAKQQQDAMQLEMAKLKMQAQNLQLEGQIKQANLGLKQKEVEIKGAEAEVNAVAKAYEVELERDQRRPVKIGNE